MKNKIIIGVLTIVVLMLIFLFAGNSFGMFGGRGLLVFFVLMMILTWIATILFGILVEDDTTFEEEMESERDRENDSV